MSGASFHLHRKGIIAAEVAKPGEQTDTHDSRKVQLGLPAKARCAEEREAVTFLSKHCLESSFPACLQSLCLRH